MKKNKPPINTEKCDIPSLMTCSKELIGLEAKESGISSAPKTVNQVNDDELQSANSVSIENSKQNESDE